MKTRISLISLSTIVSLGGFVLSAHADQTNVVSTGTTNTTGIVLNGGNDTIIVETNAAVVVSSTNSPAVVAVDPGGGTNVVENRGIISARGTLPPSTNATLTMVAVRTVGGHNTITNANAGVRPAPQVGAALEVAAVSGLIEASASVGVELASGNQAINGVATATGIASGGNDTIFNSSAINATADSTLTRGNPLVLSLVGLENGTNSTIAEATATGIASGSGTNNITNAGAVGATANAKINPFEIRLSLGDASSVDSTLTANATATGISGGSGFMSGANLGLVTANANASVESTSISATLVNAVTADASLNANAKATGIAAGSGGSIIHNAGHVIEANSSALAKTVGVNLSLATFGKASQTLDADAQATGIAGGATRDELINEGTVNATANSDASRTGISATLYDFSAVQETVDATTDSDTTSKAAAVGMDGVAGNDSMANLERVSATANSSVFALDVSLSSVGIPNSSDVSNVISGESLAELNRVAVATAKGMAGGLGDDEILNAGLLTANANAETEVVSADVGLSLPIPLTPNVGVSLAGAGSSNSAVAIGIEGGQGSDEIVNANAGVMQVGADSKATSWAIAASLDLGLDSSTNSSFNVSASLLESKTVSEAVATGIASGDGINSVRNGGSINTAADANSLSVVANLNFAVDSKGLGIAVPMADASTIASATATGILGGAGDDTLVNATNGSSTVSAKSHANSWLVSADIKGKAEGLSIGVPVADASVISETAATGVDSGDGNNRVINEGYLNTTATSVADNKVASLQITGTAKGVAAGASVAKASTTSTSTATGILCGAGNDQIVNDVSATNKVAATTDANSLGVAVSFVGPTTGVAVALGRVEAETLSEAKTLGISAGDGTNSVHNNGVTDASATAKTLNVGIAGGITVTLDTGVGISGAQVDGNSTARAESVGIAAGNGGNLILNAGDIRANATTEATTVSVAVNVNIGLAGVGVFDADASALGDSLATGILGGAGKDVITNSTEADIAATAKSEIKAAAVGVNISIVGGGVTDASTMATNIATGVAGGEGQDTIGNEGHVAVTASAYGAATSVNFAGVVGGGVAKAGTTIEATAAGLDGGMGADNLINTGTIDVLANSEGKSASVQLVGFGASFADANVLVGASSIGISGGADNDWIENQGAINAGSFVTSRATSVAGNLIGVSVAEANSTARGEAVGIAGETGDDTINNLGGVTVKSGGTNILNSVSIGWTGAGFASAAVTATNLATGIAGGEGADNISNAGALDVGVVSKTTSKSSSFRLIGSASSEAFGKPVAEAVGISGGDGPNSVFNQSEVVVTAASDSTSETTSFTLIGGGSTAPATGSGTVAKGFVSGNGNDAFTNSGSLMVKADSRATATGSTYSTVSVGSGKKATGNGQADAHATGVEAGDGANKVFNTGLLDVQAKADATVNAKAESDISFADYTATAFTRADSVAFGIVSGIGDDVILNGGTNRVKTTVVVTADAFSDLGLFGDANATAYAGGKAKAVGIDAGANPELGGGNDWIENTGVLESTVEMDVLGKSRADESGYAAAAAFTEDYGITAGHGVNLIINSGQLTVTSTNVKTRTQHSNPGADTTTAISETSNRSGGILTGDSNNSVVNNGTLTVNAAAYATAGTRADWYYADSFATVFTAATGIKVGNGANIITNASQLNVSALARSDAIAIADYQIWGPDVFINADRAKAVATANAEVVGILAGDGGNRIVNSGDIIVTATAVTSASASGDANVITRIENPAARAVGIQTGSGDDIIINSGRISATTWTDGVAGIGPAILSGGGNDQVHLAAGSVTVGNVELGDGDDQLIFSGADVEFGHLYGGSGKDTFVLDGAGRCAMDWEGSFFSFENILKCGDGKYTLRTGMPTMEHCEVTGGVLEVYGDCKFGEAGVRAFSEESEEYYFGAQINGDGSHGQMMVLGQADLGGEITITKGPGVFAHGATYDVMVATNGLLNGFTVTNLPASKPLLSFEMTQLADRIQVQANASFAAFGHNPVEKLVGEYLDRIASSVTGDLNNVMVEFQNLTSDEQIAQAYASLSPDSYDNFSRATFSVGQQYSRRVQQHLGDVRMSASGNRATDAMARSDRPVLLAAVGSGAEIGGILSREQQRESDLNNSLWGGAFGQWSEQDAEAGYAGYEAKPWGIAIGYDRNVTKECTLGISAAYASTHVDLNQNAGSGDIQSFSGAAYGSCLMDNIHLEGVLSYGYNDFDNRRNVVVGALTSTAESSHAGHSIGGFISGGYVWRHKSWMIEPFASLQYTYLNEDEFQESGAGGANLFVEERQTDSLVSELGCRVAYVIEQKKYTAIPELSLAWNYDYDIDERVVTAAYAGSPNATFAIPGQGVDRHGVTTGAAVTFLLGNDISTSMRYIGEIRDSYSSHMVAGELRFSF